MVGPEKCKTYTSALPNLHYRGAVYIPLLSGSLRVLLVVDWPHFCHTTTTTEILKDAKHTQLGVRENPLEPHVKVHHGIRRWLVTRWDA